MRSSSWWLLLLVWTLAAAGPGRDGRSQTPESDVSLVRRLEATEARIRQLEARSEFAGTPPARILQVASAEEESSETPAWSSLYDRGFRIRPADEQRNPFELQVNGRMQFRHAGFARNVDHWIDNAGIVRPVRNRNDFEIERGRLEFRGFFLDPNLQFFVNLDADTDDSHRVIFHDFWVNYEFGRALDLYVGKAFVPGSRDWLNGSTRTRFADRSMATTFFRPDRSLGIWATGEPIDRMFYRVMVGNGFNTTDLTPSQIDTNLAWSGSFWADLGDYGQGYSDLEWHEVPAARLGQSFTYAHSAGRDANDVPLAEQNFVRLSDGTRLIQEGALAPGVSVDQFDIYLYAIDAAFKYRGWSANAEYFFRWLQSIRGNGPLPVNRMYDHGFYVDAGYFLVPKRIEINGRISQIFGLFGDSHEYAGGINWFLNGTHNLKLTFDVTSLNRNPANNSGPNLRAGDDGILFRTQLQAAF